MSEETEEATQADTERSSGGGGEAKEKQEKQPRSDEKRDGGETKPGKMESAREGNVEREGKEGDGDGKNEDPSKGFHPSRKAIVIAVIIVVILLVAGLLYWEHARQFVSTDDAFTAGHVHQVSSRIAGTVEEVRVDDNQPVKEGDVLVRLDPRDHEVALLRARAGVQQARAQGSQAQAMIGQAQAQVAQSEAQLKRAQEDYDRFNGLYSKDTRAVSKADVDQATEGLKRARGGLDGSVANLQAAAAQGEAAQASSAASETQVKEAELQLSYCNILAPSAGKIARKTVERGQRLTPGQALLAVVSPDIWVLANLKETQLERVRIGQRVDIRIDSLKDETFYGTVNSIQEGTGATFSLLPPDNATGNFTKIVQRVPVKIVFDPESIRDFKDKIVPGLSVAPTIDLESLRDDKREAERQKREEKQNRAAESGQ